MPRAIARQLSEAARNAPDAPVELDFAPEDLGRVRMTLHPLGDGISVSLATERSDTLDLMRRHIDTLAQEFRALGYVHVAFEFGQGQKAPAEQQHPQHSDTPDPADVLPLPVPDQPASARNAGQSGPGLDLRL